MKNDTYTEWNQERKIAVHIKTRICLFTFNFLCRSRINVTQQERKKYKTPKKLIVTVPDIQKRRE